MESVELRRRRKIWKHKITIIVRNLAYKWDESGSEPYPEAKSAIIDDVSLGSTTILLENWGSIPSKSHLNKLRNYSSGFVPCGNLTAYYCD
jgi:hypothetical protein